MKNKTQFYRWFLCLCSLSTRFGDILSLSITIFLSRSLAFAGFVVAFAQQIVLIIFFFVLFLFIFSIELVYCVRHYVFFLYLSWTQILACRLTVFLVFFSLVSSLFGTFSVTALFRNNFQRNVKRVSINWLFDCLYHNTQFYSRYLLIQRRYSFAFAKHRHLLINDN